jgi:hypothetical protein
MVEDLVAYCMDICADNADDQHFLFSLLHDCTSL